MSAADAWQIMELQALATVDPEILGASTDPDYHFYYVDVASVSEGKIDLPPATIAFRGSPSRARKIVKHGDVLMATVRPNLKAFAYFARQLQDCVASTGFAVLRAKQGIDAQFVLYSILSEPITRQIDALIVGSNYPAITTTSVSQLKILTPPSAEQSKIAEVLSTVDRAIAQTEALIAKQQRIKTGLMQDLLTRGIDQHGNLRSESTHAFKDSPLGRIPVEWEVKELGQCVEFLDGKRIPLKQAARDSMEGNIPYYGASGIIDFINKWIFDEELILLGEDGENVVSRHLPLAFKITGRCWINNHAHVLRPLTNNDINFLVERLEFYDYSLLVSGSAQPKLNQRNLRKMKLPMPEYHEQRKIAATIGAVNVKIGLYAQQLNKANHLKTGLMQDLLTGKVRVTPLLEQAEEATA